MLRAPEQLLLVIYTQSSVHTVCICLISSSKLTVPGRAAVTRSCSRGTWSKLVAWNVSRSDSEHLPLDGTYTIQESAYTHVFSG